MTRRVSVDQLRASVARVLQDADTSDPPAVILEWFPGDDAAIIAAVVIAYVAGVVDAGGDVDV